MIAGHNEAPTATAPAVTTVLEFCDRKLPFRFPNSGNMQQHLQSILSGKDYPTPPLPSDYRVQTIVDIGANVGAAALWFLTAAPDARVICFEPSRANFDCLRHNLKSFPQAEAYHCGLFSSERVATLHLGASQCMQHSIVASAETGDAIESITLKRASLEFDRLGLKEISVLKIDTEGCEVPILNDLGVERLSKVEVIHLEWHSETDRRAIDALLGEHFMLASVTSNYPHRGNVTYMAKSLAARVAQIDMMRVEHPTV